MKPKSTKLILAVLVLIITCACSKDEDNNKLLNLAENEFAITPEKPSKSDEISIITYDCGYNQLDKVKKDGFNIEVVKHFNSMMKQPCVLIRDTIPLGKLDAGTYQVKFTIVDTSTNILASDYIFYTETQQLNVTN